jgi:hypothetical protein
MTKQIDELRIKVAELCGWKKEEYTNLGDDRYTPIRHITRWKKDNDIAWKPEDLPNYPADLNAMHEAEKTYIRSDNDRCIAYIHHLTKMCGCDFEWTATAQQRAECFVAAFNDPYANIKAAHRAGQIIQILPTHSTDGWFDMACRNTDAVDWKFFPVENLRIKPENI